MPSMEHETVVELVHRKPTLPGVLAASAGITVPADAAAMLVDSNLSARKPVAFAAETVTVHTWPGGKLAIVTEVQKDPPSRKKRRAWAAYVAIAASEHACDSVLIVIALHRDTAAACRHPIETGHPGFVLRPVVIGSDNTPGPAGPSAPELAVLSVLTGATDLDEPVAQAVVLAALATADAPLREDYTRVILTVASATARRVLEDMMATKLWDPFVDGWIDRGRAEGRTEGRAEGGARLLLRVLAARGFEVPADIRDRVTACTDTSQLDSWADRAATASSLGDVFRD
jgi:hypothetical protein